MTASTGLGAVAEFYQTHPISERQILEKLAAEGVSLEGLTEDVLQRHDQDHYGGIEVNDALAELAGIGAGIRVLDVCCGLGGPARYFAHNYGCNVTGIDLTPAEVKAVFKARGREGVRELLMDLAIRADLDETPVITPGAPPQTPASNLLES